MCPKCGRKVERHPGEWVTLPTGWMCPECLKAAGKVERRGFSIDSRKVISQAVEDGLEKGYDAAYQRFKQPNAFELRESIFQAVMEEISEVVNWDPV